MQTFVKLTLRLTTKVTTSPTCRRRSSSATSVSAPRSRPVAWASARASSVETSCPSSARASASRTPRDAQSRAGESLPASPVLIRFLHQAVAVHERGDPRAQGLVEELRAPRVLGVDREALAEDEARAVGRATELRDERPRLLGVDVIERQRRDAAPVVEARPEEPRVVARREVRWRLDVDVGAEHEPRDREGAQHVGERRLGVVPHREPRLRAKVLDADLPGGAVPLLQVTEGDERADALARRLADPDEGTRGEPHRELAG